MSLGTVRRDCAISCRPVFVEPHDVAARVDPDAQGEKRIWEIKRGECASAQQKGVNVPVVTERTWLGRTVPAHDVTRRVDRSKGGGRGAESTGEINRAECAPAQ